MKDPLSDSDSPKTESPTVFLFRSAVASRARATVVACLALFGVVCAANAADKAGGSPLLSSSVEVRDNPSSYEVQVTLPSKDEPQIGVRLEGRMLRIASGQGVQGARYEQSFLLPDAADGSALTMKRENGRLNITVPKASAQQAPAAAPAPLSQQTLGQSPAGLQAWSGRVLSQFARMQQQMDSIMNQAMQNFGEPDPFGNLIGSGLMDALPTGRLFNLDEKPDKFIVTANLSKEEAKNVKVEVENDRILKVTARNETTTGGKEAQNYQASDYTEVLTLPKPVDAGKMTMDYKKDGLEIVLPKKA